MKRDLILIGFGALIALVINSLFFQVEPAIENQNEKIEAVLPNEPLSIIEKESNDNPVLLEVVEKVQKKLTQSEKGKELSEIIKRFSTKDVPRELLNTNRQKEFEDEAIDPIKKDENERNIMDLFSQDKPFELNLGLQSVECKADRCRLEIYSVDGNSKFFSVIDVLGMFASQDWYKNQSIEFNKPDENGIRTLYLSPSENNDMDVSIDVSKP